MKELICKAINERKAISFYYKGQKRIVEPFTLGSLETTSNLSLSAAITHLLINFFSQTFCLFARLLFLYLSYVYWL